MLYGGPPRTWFLCFLLSSIIEVVVYFHEFYQKPTTLDGDGIVISTAHLSKQSHVSAFSVKYRQNYLKRRLLYSCSHPGSYNPTTVSNQEAHMIYGNMDG